MTRLVPDVATFLSREPVAIVAELTTVRGSSPRAQGTFMLVGAESIFGTIGGGALEYLVIAHARRLIAARRASEVMDVPLGPEIGQCCGGRVGVSLRHVTPDLARELSARLAAEEAERPHVYVFGAGHVGRALARCLALLPVKTHVVDTRREELSDLPENVSTHASAMPEAVVRSAPRGSAYVILTHDHALDFLIAAEALNRTDAPYVGMVGSRTKRARFAKWFLSEGGDLPALDRLTLPIGQMGIGDKRPEVIAALAAAEIMVHIGRREVSGASRPATIESGAVDGR
ncbi:xanthine dehydrogenase accessory protein XdhC [Devosia nitrariae]|uniref:Xanthine dehydrogenase accessory protein XdhC n=1 Tax=Devosia nitrariae TaxID=2071872 RepID=A0ABQ5W7D3_9HYPH|nr:xanthine dehydrogenase accessory protein XdhC [Devosia nitrariae]GLQ55673.1 xanthine dehydrogenase accessory protein XdhC [Devosia nitrariae]